MEVGLLPDLAFCSVQIDGMRMDLVKPRYETFDELYEYCYKVAGTVGLMTTPVMGVDPAYKVCCVSSSSMWMLCFIESALIIPAHL